MARSTPETMGWRSYPKAAFERRSTVPFDMIRPLLGEATGVDPRTDADDDPPSLNTPSAHRRRASEGLGQALVDQVHHADPRLRPRKPAALVRQLHDARVGLLGHL